MIVVPKDILNNDVKNNKLGPGPVAQCVLRLVKCFLSLYQNRGLGLIPGGKILEYRQEDGRIERIPRQLKDTVLMIRVSLDWLRALSAACQMLQVWL